MTIEKPLTLKAEENIFLIILKCAINDPINCVRFTLCQIFYNYFIIISILNLKQIFFLLNLLKFFKKYFIFD